jgi:hypothetical protein
MARKATTKSKAVNKQILKSILSAAVADGTVSGREMVDIDVHGGESELLERRPLFVVFKAYRLILAGRPEDAQEVLESPRARVDMRGVGYPRDFESTWDEAERTSFISAR